MPLKPSLGKLKPLLLPAIGMLMAGISLLDLAAPLGKTMWALYIILLLLTPQTLSWQFSVLIAAAAGPASTPRF